MNLNYLGLDLTSLVSTHRYVLIDKNTEIGKGGIRKKTTAAGDIVYEIFPMFRNQGYGREFLRLLLIEAKKLGMNKAILVCRVHNLASKKIIESNGGILNSEIERKKGGNRLQYEIHLR